MFNLRPMPHRAKDPLMAFDSHLKSHTPEELPADNGVAEAPRNEEPGSGEKSEAVITVSGEVGTKPRCPRSGGRRRSPLCRTSSTSKSSKSCVMPRPSKQLRIAGTISSFSTKSRSGSQASSPLPLLSGASWDATACPPLPRVPSTGSWSTPDGFSCSWPRSS